MLIGLGEGMPVIGLGIEEGDFHRLAVLVLGGAAIYK